MIADIKLFLTDVDGCMTDGGMYYSANGDEMKRFCVYDGMGMVMLRKAGIKCGILTSENNEIVRRRAARLNLDYLRMGVGRQVDDVTVTKLDACRAICDEMGISLEQVCYVGDDINDKDILMAVGLPVCPRNAVDIIKNIPGILQLAHSGGEGAIREICDMILQSNKIKL